MSDLQRLTDAFDAGALVRPGPPALNLVDVAQALAIACGVEGTTPTEHGRSLASRLRTADHLVFLLADGLGINFIDSMPRDAWLRRHTERAIHAPFPSTTTAAITSLATCAHPAEHAVVGWWTYLSQIRAPVTVFTGRRVEDDVPIATQGLGVRDLSPLEPVLARMHRDAAIVQPASIVDSDFTRYLASGLPRIGYRTHQQAVDAIARRIASAAGPTYTHWYTTVPDSLAHDHGTRSERTRAALIDLDHAVRDLDLQLRQLGVRYRMLVTADHGHLDVGGAGHLEVGATDPLLRRLHSPPSGDMRTQFWHVREGQGDAFAEAFRDRFGDWFALVTTDELDALRLLGPGPMTPETRLRVGDYTSIALGAEVLRYTGAEGRERFLAQRSHHSGLTPDEMLIPLILAGNDGTV